MNETITWIWFGGGVLLLAIELFFPHLIVCFLGGAAIVVAALRWLGLIPGFVESFAVWLVTSVVLLVGLRHFLVKWLPSESSVGITDEDVDAVGTIVEVVETVSEADQGRIRFGGTTWPAVSSSGTLLPGQKAKLLYRNNLVWVVESHHEFQQELDKES